MATKPDSRISWLQLLQRGQHYMKAWPAEKRLAPVFPENRVARATRFGIRIMPPLAVFTLTWQIALGGQLGPAIATALFACSLPLQGLWWLGRRSVTPLPPTLAQWFHEIRHKLLESGQALAPLEEAPTYQALADVLKRAFNQLDKTFLDDL
ncbi:terminus macrodomain insulation protein YfbV [Pectobacterium versatile]|uniref:terminus macrodomain insulation protein YfbV n=1 Tax=Pectobacterium versatile TaxID=2488639 RepID=UPI001CD03AFC|nr:terminus macrodomain insulation protein YfbV [Pectobacterium versatile]